MAPDARAGLDAYIALLQRCWAQQPEQRPSFREVARELRWACGLPCALPAAHSISTLD
jgi:hypothetical protein